MYSICIQDFLERAARLSDELGGGSLTALPIIETQAGDVSAYIPTNVISITDGQIYLETEMFNSGFRPADQCRTFCIPCRWFCTDQGDEEDRWHQSVLILHSTVSWQPLHSSVRNWMQRLPRRLAQGVRIKEILKQPQYQPMPVEYQIIIIYAAVKKLSS